MRSRSSNSGVFAFQIAPFGIIGSTRFQTPSSLSTFAPSASVAFNRSLSSTTPEDTNADRPRVAGSPSLVGEGDLYALMGNDEAQVLVPAEDPPTGRTLVLHRLVEGREVGVSAPAAARALTRLVEGRTTFSGGAPWRRFSSVTHGVPPIPKT